MELPYGGQTRRKNAEPTIIAGTLGASISSDDRTTVLE